MMVRWYLLYILQIIVTFLFPYILILKCALDNNKGTDIYCQTISSSNSTARKRKKKTTALSQGKALIVYTIYNIRLFFANIFYT